MNYELKAQPYNLTNWSCPQSSKFFHSPLPQQEKVKKLSSPTKIQNLFIALFFPSHHTPSPGLEKTAP